MPLDNTNRVLYLRSSLKFGFWSGDTAPTQFFGPVNFTKLALKSQTQENEKLLSNMEENPGEALASVPKPTESASLAADFDSMTGNLLALLLGADTSDLSQAEATVTDEAVTTVLNTWVPLANRYLSTSGFALKTAPSTVIDPSKYEVDSINGLIRALHADAVGSKLATYTKAARTGEIYKAGKAKSAYVQFLGTATEKVTQRRCRIKIHKASLSASGEFDLAVGGYIKGSLAGDMLSPTGETSPWQFEYLDLAAA